jgi:tetratricopeptide (TPR) repeat protein
LDRQIQAVGATAPQNTALRTLALVVAVLGLCCAVSARAHLPELFGRTFVLEPESGAPPTARPAPEEDGSALDRVREAEALENALKTLEMQTGPYAGDLSDPLMQLATLYSQQGNAVAALRRLDQALHVLRINNGLLHPVQLPVLRQLPELYAQIGDFESGQLVWRYAYRIHGFAELPLADDALEDALAYFQFARDAFIAPGSTIGNRRFLEAYQDNEDLFDRLRDSENADADQLLAVGISFLRNLYVVLGTDISGELGPVSGDIAASGYERMRGMQTFGLRRGLDVLDLLLEVAVDGSAVERAQLLVERANWQQWNGKTQSAAEDYLSAFALLDESPAALSLRSQLAQPALLPEDRTLWRSLQGPDMPVRAVVRASYEVSETGDARELEVEAEGDASAALAGRLRRILAESHYRPALRDGIGFSATVTGRRYRLLR